MKLLALAVLVCVSAVAAQRLGVIGSDVGNRVGSGIGMGVGVALDTVPAFLGRVSRRDLTVTRPVARAPRSVPRGSGYSRGDEYGTRDHERRSSAAGGREYDRQGSGGDYAKGGSYNREKSVTVREQGNEFEKGRGHQSSERGRAGGRTDSYGRDRADTSRRYSEGHGPSRLY